MADNLAQYEQQQIEDDQKNQPLGGEMGGPPMMLGGASSSDQAETSGNLRASRTSDSNPFDFNSPHQNSIVQQQNPFGGSPFQAQQPPMTQATLIKSVLKLIPKFGQSDKDRHQYREQIADSLIREGTNMSKDRLQELDKQIKQFVEQQQSKFSNDGCSSGGSQGGQLSPHTLATSIDSSNNKVALVIQLSLWVEEIIFEKFQDSTTANYRTLVRRLSQALRQKEEQKSTLMTCSDQQSVANFVQEFMNLRNSGVNSSGPFGRSSTASQSQVAQGAPGTGNGMGGMAQNNSANAGGQADSMNTESQNNQEQSAQQNPFGNVKSPFGAPSRGAFPGRGGPGRGRAPGRFPTRGGPGRGRGITQRFVDPMANFSVPASSGSQISNAPPLPKSDNDQMQTNQQSISTEMTHPESSMPPSTTNQSPQQQMIESGTDYDSSVLMTTSLSPPIGGAQHPQISIENQIKGNDQNSDEREGPLMSQNFSSQLKDSGSLERDPHKEEPTNKADFSLNNLDFIDQIVQQQQNQFSGGGDSGAPNMNMHGQTQNNQNSNLIQEKNFEIGPSSGDQDKFNQSKDNQNLQSQANEQQQIVMGDSRLRAQKKIDKEEISSVGISKFQNENEERPDFDRSPADQNIQHQPINAQTHITQSIVPNSSSQIFQGQQEVISNHQNASNLFPEQQPGILEQKQSNSNHGFQQSQFDQSPQELSNNQESIVSSQRQIQNQQDDVDKYDEQKPHAQNSNQQQEQFGGNQDTDDTAANEARGSQELIQGLYLAPGETGSQQQQNQQNSNEQQAIDNTTNQQNSQPPGSIDEIGGEPVQQIQMNFNTMEDELIEDPSMVNKLNLSMHSKPSAATSGRMTPPSNYSKSSRRMTGAAKNSGSRKTIGNENDGTGSVQMSNDQSAGDTFMQQMQSIQNQHKKINEQQMYSTNRNSNPGPMSGGLPTPLAGGEHTDPIMNPYRSFNNEGSQMSFNLKKGKHASEIVIDEYQSEQHYGQKSSQRSSQKIKKSSKASSKYKVSGVHFNQSHGYIPHPSISPSDQIGATSVASIPITTFEDTQKMLQAYKKKKREIMKMKDQYFKLEQEFLTVKQKNVLVEEELSTTQKRLNRVEKQLKQNQLKEHINDDSIVQRQLQLKNQEQELIQSELKHQKAENHKLREKVKDLLKKCSQATQQSSSSMESGITQSSHSEQDIRVIEQQHQLELVKQREQKNLEIRQLQDELNFIKQQNEQLKTEQETNQNSMAMMQSQQQNTRSDFQRQIEEIQQKNQEEINQLKAHNDSLNVQLNEQKFKRASRPQSGNNESASRHKAEIANYEKIVADLNQKLKDQQDLYAQEKQIFLADFEVKQSQYQQLHQERELMQIQLDQQDEQIKQYHQLQEEVSERADRLDLENNQLKQNLEQVKQQLLAAQASTNSKQEQIASLSQSQQEWQVVERASDKQPKQMKSPFQANVEEPNQFQPKSKVENFQLQKEVVNNSQSVPKVQAQSYIPETNTEIKPVQQMNQSKEAKNSMPPTAQSLFSGENSQMQEESAIENKNYFANQAFDIPPSGGSIQQTKQQQQNQNFFSSGGTSNVMIQSKYFGESSNKQNDEITASSFFDNLAYSQQQQPQGSQQHKPGKSAAHYNFDDSSSSQLMPATSNMNQPIAQKAVSPAPMPVAQKQQHPQQTTQNVQAAQMVQQQQEDENPYDFMLDDDDEPASNSGNQVPPGGMGSVIPNSMFD